MSKDQEPVIQWGYSRRTVYPHYYVGVMKGPLVGTLLEFVIPESQANDRDMLEIVRCLRRMNNRSENGAGHV